MNSITPSQQTSNKAGTGANEPRDLLLKHGWSFLSILVGLAIAVAGARSTDPFRRIRFSVPRAFTAAKAIAISPRAGPAVGVIVCAGLPIGDEGRALRYLAEQNLIAVAWDEEPSAGHRQERLAQLASAMTSMPWASGLPIGMLIIDPATSRIQEDRGEPFVHVADEWRFDENGRLARKSDKFRGRVSHPSVDDQGLDIVIEANRATIHCHDTDAYQRLAITRVVGEMFAARWAIISPLPINVAAGSRRLVLAWLSIGGAVTLVSLFLSVRWRGENTFPSTVRWPRVFPLSLGLALWVVVITMVMLVANALKVTKPKSYWHAICQKLGSAVSIDEAAVDEHVSLALLQRTRFYTKLDSSTFCTSVLNPIVGSAPDTRWRRELWSVIYPHVRITRDPGMAAHIVVAFLRGRVTVTDAPCTGSISDQWRSGRTDARGFELLYVASLRSIGVAARLNLRGKAEMLGLNGWQLAPRPSRLETVSWSVHKADSAH